LEDDTSTSAVEQVPSIVQHRGCSANSFDSALEEENFSDCREVEEDVEECREVEEDVEECREVEEDVEECREVEEVWERRLLVASLLLLW